MSFERMVAISPDHPSLPGHFPGHPVVPGVVLLNEIIETLRGMVGQPVLVTGMPSVKFVSPLKPGEALTIHIEQEEAGQALFKCQVGRRLVASGMLTFTMSHGEQGGS
jgi:3-hydroxyacyl-[acyl-carrier-protein] dehydratase